MDYEIQLPAGVDPLLVSSIIVDPRQRRLLRALQEVSAPLTERDLAVHLAALAEEKSPTEVTEIECEEQQVALHHRFLPQMEQAGLIERHVDGFVATGQVSLEEMEWTLPQCDHSEAPSWDVLGALLARPRRQHILSVLAEHRRSIPLEDLATELARNLSSRTKDGGKNDPGLQATLHHVDLPVLDDVGLIDYDSDEKTISCESSSMAFGRQTDGGTADNTGSHS